MQHMINLNNYVKCEHETVIALLTCKMALDQHHSYHFCLFFLCCNKYEEFEGESQTLPFFL